MNLATVAPPCDRCGGSSWLGVMNPCPDCQGHACGLCGARAVVVWHLTAEGALVDTEARCWEHRHLRRDAITSRERLREACAAMCSLCAEASSDYPKVARFRDAHGEGWFHLEEDPAEEGWIQAAPCKASGLRDQVDPAGALEGGPAQDGTYQMCDCPCHDGGAWFVEACYTCEDRNLWDIEEQLADLLLGVQSPGRCLVGAATALVAEHADQQRRLAEQDAELDRLRELLKEIDCRRIEAESVGRRLRSSLERLQADLARLRRLVDTDDDTDEGE